MAATGFIWPGRASCAHSLPSKLSSDFFVIQHFLILTILCHHFIDILSTNCFDEFPGLHNEAARE
ncbi:hypothetical protein D3C71_1672150 [compost metagenome]